GMRPRLAVKLYAWWSSHAPTLDRRAPPPFPVPCSPFPLLLLIRQVLGRDVVHQLALLEHQHALLHALHQAEVVAGHQHAGAALGQGREQRHDFRGQPRVEVAGRLVGHQQPRLPDHRAGDADALLFTGRELGRQRALALGQAQALEHRAHALADLAALHAAQHQRQRDVVEHAAVGQQAVVLEHHADLAPVHRHPAATHLQQVAVGEEHGAAGRALGQVDQLQQRALAGAGVPGDEKHFARLHFETDLRQRDMPPGVLLADVVEAQDRHAAILALRPRSVLRAGRAGDQRLEAAADPGQQRRRRGRGRFRRLRAGGRLLALARGARLLRGTRVALLACGLRLAIRLHVRLATLDALAAAAAAALARGTLAFGSRGRGRRGGRFGPGRRGRRARLAGGTLGRGRLAPARARAALAALAALAARAATATAAATALLLGRALLARLAEDLAHALAVLVGRALAGCARQGHQQFRGHRLDRDLLLDVGLDVRQRHRVTLAGEADRVALGAQPRGAADAVHVVLGVERQVVVVDVLHAVDVQAAGGDVGGDQD